MNSRRRGYVHPDCYEKIAEELSLDGAFGEDDVIALVLSGPGIIDRESRLVAYLCTDKGEILESRDICFNEFSGMEKTIETIAGRTLDEAYRGFVLLNCAVKKMPDDRPDQVFIKKRKQVVGEIHRSGLI
jgi:hypothetical protein